MSKYALEETDQFLTDVEGAAVWILLSNIEESEALANKKIAEFQKNLEALKEQLRDFPESGENDELPGLRKFPIYGGRYSAKWVIIHTARIVILVALTDSKYPRKLREFRLDE